MHYNWHIMLTADDGPEYLKERCEQVLLCESSRLDDASSYIHRCLLNVWAGDLWTASALYREARALANSARCRPYQRGLALTWIGAVWEHAQHEHFRARHDEADFAVFLRAVETQLLPVLDDDHLTINVFRAYLRRAQRTVKRIRRRQTLFTDKAMP